MERDGIYMLESQKSEKVHAGMKKSTSQIPDTSCSSASRKPEIDCRRQLRKRMTSRSRTSNCKTSEIASHSGSDAIRLTGARGQDKNLGCQAFLLVLQVG